MIKSTDDYKVICASKYFTSDEIRIIYQNGYHEFGENKVQDMINKMDELDDLDITWHFIGHLQTNKVKYMINRIDLLHTLDRISLAKTIQKQANHKINCLIQVNISEEVQKSGVLLENLAEFLIEIKNYDKINVVGFMCMGKLDDIDETNRIFKQMYELKQTYKYPYLSMGMTDDYEVALTYHATHVRIGRLFKTMIK
jgi:pyridoxal phosphate enzyme (YggS family)